MPFPIPVGFPVVWSGPADPRLAALSHPEPDGQGPLQSHGSDLTPVPGLSWHGRNVLCSQSWIDEEIAALGKDEKSANLLKEAQQWLFPENGKLKNYCLGATLHPNLRLTGQLYCGKLRATNYDIECTIIPGWRISRISLREPGLGTDIIDVHDPGAEPMRRIKLSRPTMLSHVEWMSREGHEQICQALREVIGPQELTRMITALLVQEQEPINVPSLLRGMPRKSEPTSSLIEGLKRYFGEGSTQTSWIPKMSEEVPQTINSQLETNYEGKGHDKALLGMPATPFLIPAYRDNEGVWQAYVPHNEGDGQMATRPLVEVLEQQQKTWEDRERENKLILSETNDGLPLQQLRRQAQAREALRKVRRQRTYVNFLTLKSWPVDDEINAGNVRQKCPNLSIQDQAIVIVVGKKRWEEAFEKTDTLIRADKHKKTEALPRGVFFQQNREKYGYRVKLRGSIAADIQLISRASKPTELRTEKDGLTLALAVCSYLKDKLDELLTNINSFITQEMLPRYVELVIKQFKALKAVTGDNILIEEFQSMTYQNENLWEKALMTAMKEDSVILPMGVRKLKGGYEAGLPRKTDASRQLAFVETKERSKVLACALAIATRRALENAASATAESERNHPKRKKRKREDTEDT